jgi:uracil-DNA glycosylase
LLACLPQIELTLLIGQYAQRHFLGSRRKPSLAATVRAWPEYAPLYMPLPHPVPRNQPWLQRHPWFERRLVSVLRARIDALAERRNQGWRE